MTVSAGIKQEKKTLRAQLRQRRASISAASRAEKNHQICANLIKQTAELDFTKVFTYHAINSEPDLADIVNLWGTEKVFALPTVVGKNLVFRQWQPTDNLVLGKFNIKEPLTGERLSPDKKTVVLLPCIALDRKGNRLGYGGGYYDRFLATGTEEVTTIGVCYHEFLLPKLPAAPHDRKLDYIVTEKEFLQTTSDNNS